MIPSPHRPAQPALLGWGADAFAKLKSVVRTCQKNGLNFLEYGLTLLRARSAGLPLPLPLDSS